MLAYAKFLLITSHAYIVVVIMIAVSIVVDHFTDPVGHNNPEPSAGASGAISGSGRARSSSRGRAPAAARGGAASSHGRGDATVVASFLKEMMRRVAERR